MANQHIKIKKRTSTNTLVYRYIIEHRKADLGNLRDDTKNHSLGCKQPYDSLAPDIDSIAEEVRPILPPMHILVSIKAWDGTKKLFAESMFPDDPFSDLCLGPPRRIKDVPEFQTIP